MPRDEFTAEAFFKGFTEGWTAAGGDETVGSCPVPEPHFEEVEYLIDQVIASDHPQHSRDLYSTLPRVVEWNIASINARGRKSTFSVASSARHPLDK